MFEHIDQTLVKKAQRPHRCEWCGERIQKGSSYTKRVYKFEGDFNHACQHNECFRAMCSNQWESNEGFDFGMFARGRTDDDRSQPPSY
jgi:hypothetical protein